MIDLSLFSAFGVAGPKMGTGWVSRLEIRGCKSGAALQSQIAEGVGFEPTRPLARPNGFQGPVFEFATWLD
jgi:hypothetical protein